MTIQVEQGIPHCERCGIMIHAKRRRIGAVDAAGRPVVFCSELCRDEYAVRAGLSEPGTWQDATVAVRR